MGLAINAHEMSKIVDKKGHINVIQVELCKTSIVENRALTMIHRLANHSTDYGVAIHRLHPAITFSNWDI
jgi:hypothetical protein